VAELFSLGDRVRTIGTDPPHHTRLPRYARGAAGTVVGLQGCYPLPDRRARQLKGELEPVYAVRFEAAELFGEGDHAVIIALWRSYLYPATTEGTR
jgi:nitrile hydratase